MALGWVATSQWQLCLGKESMNFGGNYLSLPLKKISAPIPQIDGDIGSHSGIKKWRDRAWEWIVLPHSIPALKTWKQQGARVHLFFFRSGCVYMLEELFIPSEAWKVSLAQCFYLVTLRKDSLSTLLSFYF